MATAASTIAKLLRKEIIGGVRRSGERVMQDGIASAYGVSQTIVREAFSQLVAEGFLTAEPRRGVSVAALNADDALELAELRSFLEAKALRYSIPLLTAEQLQTSADILEHLNGCEDENEVLDWNAAFHDSLYAAAPRPRTLALVTSLRLNFDRYFRFVAEEPDQLQQSHAEHQQLLELCVARKAAAASRLVAAHILQTGEVVCRRLQSVSHA
ncbi:GntR family transcriptional regulator [Paraburkholderia sp. J12]|uniref:GntR family transcriptional regulator n=1 Tax=Paraburkholderia sp. J12 TaxID=2805432 RepID=UPI002ABDB830|nr:GntR family transcriptional regulator [Paraburkholderia sp. J12]